MGLDVYLYRYEKPMEEVDRLEAEAEKLHDAISDEALRTFGAKDFSALGKEQHGDYFAACKREYAKHGLDKYGGATDAALGKTRVEHKDPRYPDHCFEIGYFRSSYNDGGINHVLRGAGIGDLGDIFPEHDGAYRFSPDWAAALDRAKATLAAYEKHLAYASGAKVMRLRANPFTDPRELPASEKAALDLFIAKRAENGNRHPDMAAFGTREGDFWMGDPVKVRAVIHGTFRGRDACIYVVYETEAEERDWYCKALDIVIATIEYVLTQPQPEQYALHWSG